MLLAHLRQSSPLVTPSTAASGAAPSGVARRRAAKVIRFLSVLLCASAAVACAKQGEGERCDLLSGNDDCDEGLICISLDERNQGVGAVCCPREGDSKSAICKGNSVDLTGDAGDTSSSSGSSSSEADAATGADARVADASTDAAAASSDANTVDGSTTDGSTTDGSGDTSSSSSASTDDEDASLSDAASADANTSESSESESVSSDESLTSEADAGNDASAG